MKDVAGGEAEATGEFIVGSPLYLQGVGLQLQKMKSKNCSTSS